MCVLCVYICMLSRSLVASCCFVFLEPTRRRYIGYRGFPQGSPHPNCFRLLPSAQARTLQKPYRRLLELPLGDVAAAVVPGHENMFRVTMVDSHPDKAGMVVVLRDCSLRDRWLQALATAGGHVDVAGSCLTASTGETSYPDAPVRWLR